MKIAGKVYSKYNEFENMVVDIVDTLPSSGVEAQVVYNTSDGNTYIYDGTDWKEIIYSTSTGIFLALDGSISPTTDIDWGNHRIINLGSPLSLQDATTKEYVDVNISIIGESTFLSLSGSNSPSANISWNNHRIVNLGDPVNGLDAANKQYVDNVVASYGSDYMAIDNSNPPVTDIDWNTHKVINLGDPVDQQDAATKNYIDNIVNGGGDYFKLDGTNSPTADISWNGNQIVNLATPTDNTDAANLAYFQSLTYSARRIVLHSQLIDPGVSMGDVVYKDPSTGVWNRAIKPKDVKGLYIGSNSVLLFGYTDALSGFTPGADYYLDENNQLTDVNTFNRVGFALSSTEFIFDPDVRYGEFGDRAVFAGGYGGTDIIDYIEISTISNAFAFGDLTQENYGLAATSSGPYDRAVYGGGVSPFTNVIQYTTISSLSNAFFFGELNVQRGYLAASSNRYKGTGVFAGGYTGSTAVSTMESITIGTSSNSPVLFGNLTQSRYGLTATSNEDIERIVMAGGVTNINITDYIDIPSLTDAADFGNLSFGRGYLSGTSNGPYDRGIFAGGEGPVNVIDYISISTLGSAQDFGDLYLDSYGLDATSNRLNNRAVFAGGNDPAINVIQYTNISVFGDAQDFGDLTANRRHVAATSNA